MATHNSGEYLAVREDCGWFALADWSLIELRGRDVFQFLQTQTTNDVRLLQPGQGQYSAIVDRKARITATFSLHKTAETGALILVESLQRESLLKHLEAFIFRDDVTLGTPAQNSLVALQGPKSPLLLKKIFPEIPPPEKANDCCGAVLDGHSSTVINRSLTGEEGFVIACPETARELLQNRLQSLAVMPIGDNTRETLRIEAGIPRFAADMDPSNILPETGLEHVSVSYNKGCYIGQEVIARIKTYGSPATALMGLAFANAGEAPPPGEPLLLDGKKIGETRSSVFSPALQCPVSLAYIQKEHRVPDLSLNLEIAGEKYAAKIVLLPFYQASDRKAHARKLLDRALGFYKSEDDLDRPIRLLREAVELAPKLAPAYEALGVLLSKQDKLDEAIALMKRLAEIDPAEIMAHTNLSIYYMKQGRIEEAEKEKAEATALQFEKILADKQAKKSREAEEEKVRLERLEKISLFRKVLELDPADQIANFGLGSICYELGRHEEAMAPLQLLVREYKTYSAAWLLLGKNLEKLARRGEAIETYRQGIAAASKKGDLIPLREMQNRLNQLLHSGS